jgi:hypothetical protein
VAGLLGDLQLLAGRPDEAARSFDLVRAADSLLEASGSVVDLEAALFASDHGDPATGVRLAQRAYDARRTVFTADALAWALVRAGRGAEAVPFVAESLALSTASPALRFHAAVVYDSVGDAARAADQLRQAFTFSPWAVPVYRAEAAALGLKLGVAVPAAWAAP